MIESLANQTALVTGAARGIGAAIAGHLAARGVAVVVADVDRSGETTADSLRSQGHRAAFIQTDVGDPGAVTAAVAFAESTFGGLDIVVSNAGLSARGTLENTTPELWDRIHATNLRGPFFLAQAAVPALTRRGGGNIVTITSLQSKISTPDLLAYGASKAGLVTLTRSLARLLAPKHIRVNAIHPGWVLSEGEVQIQAAAGLSPEDMKRRGTSFPLGRITLPEDIAQTVGFLVSERASQITGQILAVDGGIGLHR